MGRKWIISVHRLQSVFKGTREGAQDRKLKARTEELPWRKAAYLLSGSHTFVTEAVQGMVSHTVGCALTSTSIPNQDNAQQASPQVKVKETVLQLRFLLPNCSR